MIVYQDILGKLTDAGYTTYKLQKEKIIPNSTMTRLRQNLPISTETLDIICTLCECQPGELLAWVPDKRPEE